jgi:hypothetical protein
VAKVIGTVRRIGVEGGVLALVTDDGRTIELVDPPDGLARDGLRVEVDLDRADADASIGMLGGLGRVRSFRTL